MESEPTISEQAENLSKAVYDACLGFIKTGKVRADVETRKKRKSTCMQCDIRKGNKCRHCGCNLPAKIALMTSQCPKGKW